MISHSLQNDYIQFYFQSSTDMITASPLHCHDYYEIYYFVSGDADFMLEGKHYHLEPGDLFLFRPNQVHRVTVSSTKPYQRYIFHFKPEYIEKEYRDVLLAPFGEKNQFYKNAPVKGLLDLILQCDEFPISIKEISINCRFLTFLTELYTLLPRPYTETKSKQVESVIHFINEHISEDISLDLISANFYISKSQLNRMFKKSMNTTIWSYISLKRVTLARQLIFQGTPIEKASLQAGFKDYSTFFRTYKKIMGHAPSATHLRMFKEN